MSAPSHYQVTVSKVEVNSISKEKRYSHYFTTSESHGQHMNLNDVKEMVKTFREKFTEAEGYKVTATYWNCSGREVSA
jgi:hypothetical protein